MYDTLFLDRDVVINKKLEGRYVTNFNEFEGIFLLLKIFGLKLNSSSTFVNGLNIEE